jgi:hypothetical protein
MTTPRPPDEVFCMTCGPAAALDRDPRAPVLRCARCGARQRVPALPLFVVTGASGAGKTTIAEHQRFAGWLRTNIQPCYDTSALTPDETAAQIAAWVRHRLAAVCSGGDA